MDAVVDVWWRQTRELVGGFPLGPMLLSRLLVLGSWGPVLRWSVHRGWRQGGAAQRVLASSSAQALKFRPDDRGWAGVVLTAGGRDLLESAGVVEHLAAAGVVPLGDYSGGPMWPCAWGPSLVLHPAPGWRLAGDKRWLDGWVAPVVVDAAERDDDEPRRTWPTGRFEVVQQGRLGRLAEVFEVLPEPARPAVA